MEKQQRKLTLLFSALHGLDQPSEAFLEKPEILMNYEKLTERARFLKRSTLYVTDGTCADIYELSLEPVPLDTVTFQICP